MRVLLISANTEQINMPVLPLGLACVAAAIDNQGHTLKMLNLMMQTDMHNEQKVSSGRCSPNFRETEKI